MNTNDDLIEDIVDCETFKNFENSTKRSKRNTEKIIYSFTLNTDGINLYSKSKISVWPVYLAINELPIVTREKNDPELAQQANKSSCRLTKTLLLSIVIVLTSWFFFVEIVVGYLTKSNALVADSFHMLSDIISLIIGLAALRFSKRESSKKNTFGWARAEVLGSLINAVFLLALCFTIVVDSISRFVKPEPLEKIDLMLAVGAGGLALNIMSLVLFGVQSCQESGEKKSMNMNLQGVFLNALGDSLGSVAVILSGLVIKFVPPRNNTHVRWKLYIDPVLSLVIAGIIVATTIPLLKKSSLILLQGVPLSCNVDELRKKIFSVEGVVDVHHFHVWSLNSEKMIASAHVRLCGEKDEKRDWETVEKVKRLLHRNNIHLTTIQLEHDDASLDSCDEECPDSLKRDKPSASKFEVKKELEESKKLIKV